jgi:hypothetical protein
LNPTPEEDDNLVDMPNVEDGGNVNITENVNIANDVPNPRHNSPTVHVPRRKLVGPRNEVPNPRPRRNRSTAPIRRRNLVGPSNEVPNPRHNSPTVPIRGRNLVGPRNTSDKDENAVDLLNVEDSGNVNITGRPNVNIAHEVPNPRPRRNRSTAPIRRRNPVGPCNEPVRRPQPRKRKPKPKPWDWFEGENEVENIPFTGKHGINPVICRQLTNKNSELDVLDQFLGNDFWQQVCNETNRKAHSYLDEGLRSVKWVDLTIDELKAYFGLVILMAQNLKANIHDNWSTRRVLHQPIFGETMSRDRFKTISRFLHFSSSVEPNDKLRKIRPIIDQFIASYKKVFTPQKEICIDESLIKFRGRLSYIQFNPSKRARFGIKIYKLNDSKTGYCYNFKVYTGKEADVQLQEGNEENADPNPDNAENPEVDENQTEHAASPEKLLLLSEKIVLEVCADLLDEGRVLYLDNWYSSPKLFLELLNRRTYGVGVVRSDRTNFPKEIQQKKLELGEFVFLHTKKILALKWRDRKDVAMLSTLHTRPVYEEVIPQREKGRPNPQPQLKPNVVINYNFNMNGVDKQDQRLSCFPVMRKCVKGYKKLFFYLFDVTLNNARIVHEIVTKKKSTMSKFRINLAEQILESVNLTNRPAGGRPSVSAESPLRLQAKHWGHFIRKIQPTSKQRPSRRCRVCSAQGRRSETVYECRKCLVPLHLETCFEVFHTQTNL